MLQLIAVHLFAALVAPVLVARFGRKVFLPLALVPGSAAVWALTQTSAVLSGSGPTEAVSWVASLGMHLTFRLDVLAWLMVLLVGGIGALVLIYCAWYFSSGAKFLGRFSGTFIAFAGAMLGLVTCDNTLVLYVFWELTTVFSYLLIGHYFERKGARRAGMQAIVVTTFGGLVMFAGFLILGVMEDGSFSLAGLVTSPPEGTAATIAIVCVLVGALTKSALVPFHFWLPGAMAAPTPVSAYLHAAAMVKAGVYLVARLAPGFAEVEAWRWIILVAGSATMLIGGYRSLKQHDLKLLLAFGTVSQLGFLVLLVGQAERAVALAGLALIGAHAMFKATLFLTVGVIDAAAGTRDLRQLSGLGRSLPWAAVPGFLATFSMVGLPPFAGYVGKEAALEALTHDGGPYESALLAVVVVGSVLTFAYGMRFLWGAFARKPGQEDTSVDREAPGLFVPGIVLAVAGLAAGVVPSLGEALLSRYAGSYPAGEAGHLTLWGGLGLPLLLTIVVIAAGLALFVGRTLVERAQDSVILGPDADRAYRTTMRRLDRGAVAITSFTQRGSLPVYLAVILLVTVSAVTIALVNSGAEPGEVRAFDTPVQLLVAGVIVIGAILTTQARRRLKAVVLLGITGYGVVVLFALHGAPDLALTQALVETISLVVFILVLRRLPAYFSNRPLKGSRWWRAALAASVAVLVMALALIIPHARIADPISILFPDEAYEYGYGRNIVNVTLVDIRAWDTMGEIAVLLVAATGVASLVFLRTRSGQVHRIRDRRSDAAAIWPSHLPDPATRLGPSIATTGHARRARTWLPAGGSLSTNRRSVILEVATRLLFHTMLVFAVFLLFSGHNAPGGGFVAGMVVGVALTVRYLAGGRYELGEAAPILPGALLGSGLFLSAGVGAVPLFFGGTVLQSVKIDAHLGILGEMHLVTSLFFDIGVFLVVVGLMLDILRSLGSEVDRQGEATGSAVPDVAHDSPRSTPDDAEPVPRAPEGQGL
ncbi:Na+/H+ antiporter subunit A [Ruania halotolerans]|uniref:Na+/H+ antiporter subunit A n=1 Tax=Ruania halotolerans TaxID=2897773 RepID=UPI001E2BDBA2|nr:Na+/H+ antiporter subunit A [Ruania halotolerans]UFU06181.1 Na+/H+ antiporter subunit A [Ruania halotolerans]